MNDYCWVIRNHLLPREVRWWLATLLGSQVGPASQECDLCSHTELWAQKGPAHGLMLCYCCLEILNNLLTRTLAFSLCTVHYKLCNWSWSHPMGGEGGNGNGRKFSTETRWRNAGKSEAGNTVSTVRVCAYVPSSSSNGLWAPLQQRWYLIQYWR